MYRRALVLGSIISCLIVILSAGVGVWGVHRGLIQAPTGFVQLGQIEVMAFTDVEFSTMRPPRAYYTIWVGLAKDPPPSLQRWLPLVWAHRVIRLSVPRSAVIMQE
jgi:hypothetical protein